MGFFQNCGGLHTLDVVNQENVFASTSGEDLNFFRAEPASQMKDFNEPLELSVDFKEDESTTYQWYHQSLTDSRFKAISGATSALYRIPNLEFGKQGNYKVIATRQGKEHESLIASVRIRGQSNSCDARDLPKFAWSLEGKGGKDWAITQYFDLDPEPVKMLDFMNFSGEDASTYDGHTGIDIAIPGFAAQDRGVDIRAAFAGIVEVIQDGQPDRQVEWNPANKANYVVVRSENGFATAYLHMRKGSLKVKPGDIVSVGQILGQVGSSGISSGPHLHVETRDCDGRSVDLMKLNQFANAPAPVFETHLMTFHARAAAINSYADILNVSGSSLTGAKSGATTYLALQLSYVQRGDRLKIDFVGPTNKVEFSIEHKAEGRRIFGLYGWWPNFYLTKVGAWKIRLFHNDVLLKEQPWTVAP